MKVLDISKDHARSCISLVTKMKLIEYKELTYSAFEDPGKLEGQRGVVKSAAAARIRKRMQEDFINGSIFPQVVVGIEDNVEIYEKMKLGQEIDTSVFTGKDIVIIDGIQRSNIYFSNFEGNEDKEIRVEFWIAEDSVQLLYRMLVLNTGQTPWNTRRQVEVVFGNLSKNIRENIFVEYPDLKDKVFITKIDDGKKRTQAGIYPENSIVELYLGFNTRNVKINVSDELAEEYQRFDMIESIDKSESLKFFVVALGLMCKMDLAFASSTYSSDNKVQFTEGKDVFASAPVRMGFIVACSEYIMGRMSVERTSEEKEEKKEKLKNQISTIICRIEKEKDNENFMGLDLLNGICANLSKSRFGDEMRRLFKDIFTSMFKDEDFDEIESLATYWRD